MHNKLIPSLFLLVLTSLAFFSGCAGSLKQASDNKPSLQSPHPQTNLIDSGPVSLVADKSKILIVYFSHTGYTQNLAGYIWEQLPADVVRLYPATAYPAEEALLMAQSKREAHAGIRPALQPLAIDPAGYGTIYLGFPNWWSSLAPPMATFLAENDLAGKVIYPFITTGGGSTGHCLEDLQKLAPGADIKEALVVRDFRVASAQEQVLLWLSQHQTAE